ncbi:cytochrome P450 [Xylariaceae sp. FL1019]|nr:cytochrome P450 [Xylariaceae sp. FL1019]
MLSHSFGKKPTRFSMTLVTASGVIWSLVIFVVACYFGLLRPARLKRNGIALRTPPNTLPLVGNGLQFLQARQKLFSWFVKCERHFGDETFQITVPTLHPGVVINDPKNLEYVFKHEGIFAKGDFVKQRSWDLFGHGIINADGALWKAQRKAGLHFLNVANLRVLTDVALPRYIEQCVGELKMRAKSGGIVDLQLVFHEITSQLMGKMAYDMEMHANDEFTLAFEHASGITTERFQNPLWFVTELITGSAFRRSLAVVRKFGNDIVQGAVASKKIPRAVSAESADTGENLLNEVSGSLIQSLLDSLGTQYNLVADAALNYLSAGRDTTAQALTWTVYLLMQNPSAVAKAREEVANLPVVQGHHAEQNQPKNAIASAVFSPVRLPYIMAVFYEALRLYPPVPFEIKECEADTTLPDGTFLPKNSVVVWCPWAMNRSKLHWGDDADAFRPERWLDEDHKLVTKSASEFPVFNGGPRTCLGKRMAEHIAAQVIATMVLTFEFLPAYEGKRVSKSSLTLPMKDGLPCYVSLRANEFFSDVA